MITTNTTKNNSHKTALTRKSLPDPTKYLLKKGKLIGEIMDYGCGKCKELNNKFFKSDGYDPVHEPLGVTHNKRYDTIICNYVLNTIEDFLVIDTILANIQNLLKSGGTAYISVRRDIKKEGTTKRGTFQQDVRLTVPIEYQNTKFCIYKLKKPGMTRQYVEEFEGVNASNGDVPYKNTSSIDGCSEFGEFLAFLNQNTELQYDFNCISNRHLSLSKEWTYQLDDDRIIFIDTTKPYYKHTNVYRNQIYKVADGHYCFKDANHGRWYEIY